MSRPDCCRWCRFWNFNGFGEASPIPYEIEAEGSLRGRMSRVERNDCRKRSPEYKSEPNYGNTRAWPQTSAYEWCGDFKNFQEAK